MRLRLTKKAGHYQNKIEVVKCIKFATGLGLRESKDLADALEKGTTVELLVTVHEQLSALLRCLEQEAIAHTNLDEENTNEKIPEALEIAMQAGATVDKLALTSLLSWITTLSWEQAHELVASLEKQGFTHFAIKNSSYWKDLQHELKRTGLAWRAIKAFEATEIPAEIIITKSAAVDIKNKVLLIKSFRDVSGLGLKESKDICDALNEKGTAYLEINNQNSWGDLLQNLKNEQLLWRRAGEPSVAPADKYAGVTYDELLGMELSVEQMLPVPDDNNTYDSNLTANEVLLISFKGDFYQELDLRLALYNFAGLSSWDAMKLIDELKLEYQHKLTLEPQYKKEFLEALEKCSVVHRLPTPEETPVIKKAAAPKDPQTPVHRQLVLNSSNGDLVAKIEMIKALKQYAAQETSLAEAKNWVEAFMQEKKMYFQLRYADLPAFTNIMNRLDIAVLEL